MYPVPQVQNAIFETIKLLSQGEHLIPLYLAFGFGTVLVFTVLCVTAYVKERDPQ